MTPHHKLLFGLLQVGMITLILLLSQPEPSTKPCTQHLCNWVQIAKVSIDHSIFRLVKKLHQIKAIHPYQTPPNQNNIYQRPQPQPNPVNEVRNDEDQGGYESEGEEAPWNESPRNRPRGQVLHGGPRGRLGPIPFERRSWEPPSRWKSMAIMKLVKKLEKNMVTAIKEGGHQRGY